MKPGTQVRFTRDSLGVIDPAMPHRFTDQVVGPSDTGTVSDLAAYGTDREWFYVEVNGDPEALVPVTDDMVEAIA